MELSYKHLAFNFIGGSKRNIREIYELQINLSQYYKKVRLKNLFKSYPSKIDGLQFGFICPGAMKTIEYLNKNKNKNNKNLIEKIKLLTDFLFFIEIFIIYDKYISDKNLLHTVNKIISNKHCKYSEIITEEISELFGKLSSKIRRDLPDNFYHIRHNTLICSNDKDIAKKRINVLKKIYN
jgi:hypothetical protein